MATLVFVFALCIHKNGSEYAYCDTGISIGRLYMQPTLAPTGQFMYSCKLDRYGRFYPDGILFMKDSEVVEKNKKATGIRAPFEFCLPLDDRVKDLFQFSSFRLIRGHKVTQPFVGNNRFVPTIGSRIISLEEYLESDELKLSSFGVWKNPAKPESNDRPPDKAHAIGIYNLPGRITPSDSRLVKSTLANFPAQPAPFKVKDGVIQEQTHRFVAASDHRIAIRFGDYVYTGTVDIELGEIIYHDTTKRQLASTVDRRSLPPWLMQPKNENESVYELRNGSLVPGFLHKLAEEEWLFVPDIGGLVIDAKEYLKTYQPWSRRIYNLTGEFKKK